MSSKFSSTSDAMIDQFMNAWKVYLRPASQSLLGLAVAGFLYILTSQAALLRLKGREGNSHIGR